MKDTKLQTNSLRLLGIIAIIAIIGLAVTSCGGGGSPSAVVKKAIAAVEKGDQKGVEATFTPEAAALINAMMEKAQGQFEKKGGIDKMNETINGDKATVNVTYKDGTTDDITLVKLNGDWKVTIEK